ncbi:MAG: hypothetical protein KKB21_02200 [Nanoarchaeota archaeon]|nr:hypothetical protein [Nanoarchaeota archaeon]MBU4086367.1 hypothetical protein [Nanoarchaeota archaeon]
MTNGIESKFSRFEKWVIGTISAVVVATCTYLPILDFAGRVDHSGYNEFKAKIDSWAQSPGLYQKYQERLQLERANQLERKTSENK